MRDGYWCQSHRHCRAWERISFIPVLPPANLDVDYARVWQDDAPVGSNPVAKKSSSPAPLTIATKDAFKGRIILADLMASMGERVPATLEETRTGRLVAGMEVVAPRSYDPGAGRRYYHKCFDGSSGVSINTQRRDCHG